MGCYVEGGMIFDKYIALFPKRYYTVSKENRTATINMT